MIGLLTAIPLILSLVVIPRAVAAEWTATTHIPLAAPDGCAMLSDGVTLVVSHAKTGKLTYFDTIKEEETRSVEMDFKPAALAVQGDTLFAGVSGGSAVYALDAKTGKVKNEFKLGADAIAQLACHPTKGLVYATTVSRAVYSIDPVLKVVTRTRGVGDFVAVDPVAGSAVYTGIKPPTNEKTYTIRTLEDGSIEMSTDRWGMRGAILKYSVQGQQLKFAALQKNAAVNPRSLVISPDGKRIMLLGAGWRNLSGLRSDADGQHVFFDTSDLQGMAGELKGGSALAFHPVLNLGIVSFEGREIGIFNARSLVERTRLTIARSADARPLLLAFAAKGTKAVLWNGDNPASPREGLHLISIPVSDEDRALLAKAYGVLPPPPEKLADAVTPNPSEPKSKTPPSKTVPPITPASRILPGRAVAGFNDKKGLNADGRANSPYTLGQSNREGGFGEPGWDGVWSTGKGISIQSEVVQEGDGALRLTGTENCYREFARPMTRLFQVEQYVLFPKNGQLTGYVWKTNAGDAGPMWRAEKGRFVALSGNGKGDGSWKDTGFKYEADKWYKLVLRIDPQKQQWEFGIDGEFYKEKLMFRHDESSMQQVNYLVESPAGAYVDAVSVDLIKDEPKKPLPPAPPKADDLIKT